ncbi:RDD family protein [Pseudomonas sp. TUM22785]|uniref:RDD family protein n=1 Tax=Pseudomonas sp. TUM22785 TaxID=3019098 RepID=UPI0023059616|nr:RDD family protein [Pseudomonas sp. TUM22785]WCD78882.1 RDD family protein [Pseudomonas sp. TUM22785]
MEATEARLRETYSGRRTEILIDLLAEGGLTEVAERVVREVLIEREASLGERVVPQPARVPAAARREELDQRLAPLWARFVASQIDFWGALLVLGLISFIIDFVFFRPATSPDIFGKVCMLLLFAYLLFKDGFNGQGIGKRLLKIRVVDSETGAPCELHKSCLRGLVSLLGIFDVLFIFGQRRQRLGDHAARTLVIRA